MGEKRKTTKQSLVHFSCIPDGILFRVFKYTGEKINNAIFWTKNQIDDGIVLEEDVKILKLIIKHIASGTHCLICKKYFDSAP